MTRVAARVGAAIGLALAGCTPRALPGGMPAVAAATYRCDDGRTIAVRFDNRTDTATARIGTRVLSLKGQRPASGIWYAGEGSSLRGKGNDAIFTEADGHAATCTTTPVR